MNFKDVQKAIQALKNPERAAFHQTYFKTEKGGYGEGDIFFGLNAKQLDATSKQYSSLPFMDIEELLKSKIHENRSVALGILVKQFKSVDDKQRKKIVSFYLKHTNSINNWDLVDGSARFIVGEYLFDKDRSILYTLAKSKNVWERRIAIISTHYFIYQSDFKDTLKISKLLLVDKHPLIHKAVGWMLREIGKKSEQTLKTFINENYEMMSRTTLRYAIERFPEAERKLYLKGAQTK